MSANDANARFVRDSVREPDPIARARAHAVEIGAAPVSTTVGAQLCLLAAAADAKSVLEVGTGAGVSGLWLLNGAPAATLTSIDSEAEHLGVARQSFADAKVPSTRVRFITGRAAEVLPRMNEGAYDIVHIDADPESLVDYLAHGLRLVRKGGLVLIPRVLAGGKVADPVQRDAVTTAYRSLIQETQESAAVLSSIAGGDEGLLQLVTL